MVTEPSTNQLGYATGLPVRGENVQATCRIDPAVSDLVDALAEQRGWTRSQALRHLIVVGLGVATRPPEA